MIPIAIGSAVGALQSLLPGSTTAKAQKFHQSFQLLGQDLQGGNAAQAQNDLAAARSAAPTNPLYAQGFNQIAQDLKLNNLSAAQSDYATLQHNLVAMKSGTAQPLKTALSTNAATQAEQIAQAWTSTQQSSAHKAYTALRGEMAAYSSFGNASDPASSRSTNGESGLSVTV